MSENASTALRPLIEALRPFADAYDRLHPLSGGSPIPDSWHVGAGLMVGDLRIAKLTLKSLNE